MNSELSGNILLVEDEETYAYMLRKKLTGEGYNIHVAERLEEAIRRLDAEAFDLVLLDVNLPDGSGLDSVQSFQGYPNQPEVVILTGNDTMDGAEHALRSGAWDYIGKTDSFNHIKLTIRRALEHHAQKLKHLRQHPFDRHGIIGSSQRLEHTVKLASKASEFDTTVLLRGRTGTGKELFARAIHANSSRKTNEFVIVDCASLAEDLIGSILFGHEKGAFTGAYQQSEGLLREADGGTLFLDEVGELPLNQQKVFLRILQEKKWRPVGGKEDVSSDFRVIAATNRDLEEDVSNGLFREDLLFRLKGMEIQIPVLKERSDDILEIANSIIRRTASQVEGRTKEISPDCLKLLEEYNWPGNIRELVNVIQYADNLSGDEPMIYEVHLPTDIRLASRKAKILESCNKGLSEVTMQQSSSDSFKIDSESLEPYSAFLDNVVKDYMIRLMEQSRNVTEAAKVSGLSKARIYQLLNKHNVKHR